MHGRSRIRQQLLADAHELKERIAKLERDLLVPGGASKPRKLMEIGYEIRSRKSRLHRLERCISALQFRQSAALRLPSVPSAVVDSPVAHRL